MTIRPLALASMAMLASTGMAAARNSWAYQHQPYGSEAPGDEAPEGYLPELSAATGTLCVKQCPADALPCDPPSYKVADGRCTTQWQ